MSDELFEVAFSGQVKDGADLEQVKAKVGAMFKADDAKLALLFSGKRMVIKKNVDQAMANKYKTALDNAGAVCEIKSLNDTAEAPAAVDAMPTQKSPLENTSPATSQQSKPVAAASSPASTIVDGDAPAAPQTDPLGISAGDIADLSAAIAPLGSDMQDKIKSVEEPQLDISGLDMAPPGSDLGQEKKVSDPPPPNTDGLSLVD